MGNYLSQKNELLEKLKKIGDLSVVNCSHCDEEISQNAKDINRLARDCFKLIRKNKN